MPNGESESSENALKKTVSGSKAATIKYLVESLQTLQEENELLKRQLMESRHPPSGRIGFVLLLVGACALVGSIVASSTVSAFIGLGLTFWGALFLFVRPVKFVRGAILGSTVLSSYTTIDRIINDLGYRGRAIYVPPFPREVYIPEYLKGLKEMIVLILAEDVVAVPAIEEMAKKQFLVKQPEGILITPPGFGIMSTLEKELAMGFTKVTVEDLLDALPKLISQNLELAKSVETKTEKGLIYVKIEDSVYKNLYSREHRLKSVRLVGCPLASAIACALSIASGKSVNITKSVTSPDLETIELWYQILES